jgi:signal transduction histidine kinase
VSSNSAPEAALPRPPYTALRAQLLDLASAFGQAGNERDAGELRSAVESWWLEQARWEERLSHLLGVHHEINNALVGVRGNAQLLMMGPAGQEPGVKERLEVLLRESSRIRDAATRLRELKVAIHGTGTSARAA